MSDTGAALIVQGDALHLPLPDESVDLICTSPPYFALRAYSAGPGEIGSEPTPQLFLEALWAATAEMVRVLKPGGSIFVNLGDKYGRPGGGADVSARTLDGIGRGATQRLPTPAGVGRDKSLMLLPERYRVGCVDRLGLITRSVIIWEKPNGLPESVTDRVRRSHEDWVHLVKQPRYYSATDEIREAYSPNKPNGPRTLGRLDPSRHDHGDAGKVMDWREIENPLGKLPGSVWSIPSEPLRLPDHLGVQHYAAFPSEWPRRLILGFSPPGICLDCGHGRVPVVERARTVDGEPVEGLGHWKRGRGETSGIGNWRFGTDATILGYACSCTPHTDHPERRGKDFHAGTDRAVQGMNDGNGGERSRRYQEQLANPPLPVREYHWDRWTPPPTRPAIILDPFAGTFTTVMVARALGRIGVGIDLSANYCKAGRWRVHHDAGKAISRTNLERQGTLL